MVNTSTTTDRLRPSAPDSRIDVLIVIYVASVAATVIALAVLAVLRPAEAPVEAWVHMAIVAAFAVLLPIRARSARRGSLGAFRSIGIIAVVLALVNAIEAVIFVLLPVWLRIEMVGTAVLMTVLAVAILAATRLRRGAAREPLR